MELLLKTIIGILIPLFGTSIGSAAVFFMKKQSKPALKNALLGFAAGVMTAASVWSLIIPSVETARESGLTPWLPSLVGFLCGAGFLLLLDVLAPIFPGGVQVKKSRLILAVTVHNFPEGMAVGVVFSGMLNGGAGITFAGALALSIGIAVQNLPEGAIISMPLASAGKRKGKAFLAGVLSGAVEPIGAALMLALTSSLSPALPYVLSFAAGAMIYVVVEELIPEAREDGNGCVPTVGFILGFAVMMVLDVALG